MGNLCAVGTEPISNPDRRLILEDGVFCTILGFQHPLCRLIDRVWYVTAQVFDLDNPSDAPIEASKFWWSWAKRFANQAMEDAATIGLRVGDLCANEPTITSSPVSYLDLVNFLTGQDDAILVKVFEIWKFRVWFDYCRCKPSVTPSSPTASVPSFATPPGIPYCGGIVSGPPPAAIANCAAQLLNSLQQILDENALDVAEFWNSLLPELDNEPYQVLPSGYWDIGGSGYYGQIGRGWKVDEFQPGTCSQDFPYYLIPNLADGQRVICSDPNGKIDIAFGGYSSLLFGGRYEIAESDLIPTNPSSSVLIPKGRVLSLYGYRQVNKALGICWYLQVTVNLPACPPTGGRFGPWNTSVPGDEISDDEAICLDVPALCVYRLPDCCGGYSVLLRPQDQIKLAQAFGFEFSQGENQ